MSEFTYVGKTFNLVKVKRDAHAYEDEHGVSHAGYIVSDKTVVTVTRVDKFWNGYEDAPLLIAQDAKLNYFEGRKNTIDYWGGIYWGSGWEEYKPSSVRAYVNADGSKFEFIVDPGYRDLPSEEKLAILKEMGFTPFGEPHQWDCPGNNPGFNCNCVPPPISWSAPKDVYDYMGEDWESRLAKARARKGK